MRFFVVAAVLSVVVAFGAVSTSGSGLNITYRIPLSLANNANGVIPTAADGSNYYVLDTIGVVFAFRAADGMLLWSAPGTFESMQISLFDGAPNYVFVVGPMSVAAMAKASGTVAATFNTSAIFGAGSAGVIIQPPSGDLILLDGHLNEKLHIPAADGLFASIAASQQYIATIWQENFGEYNERTVVFSAQTGNVLCNFSGGIDTQFFTGLPFEILGLDLLISGYVHNHYFKTVVYNLSSCEFFTTKYIGDAMNLETYSTTLLRKASGYMYAANYSATFNFTSGLPVVHSLKLFRNMVGTNNTAWSIELPSGGHPFTLMKPLLGTLPFQPDAITVYWNSMIGGFNSTTGEMLWNVTQQLPVGPANAANQFIFPLGSGSLFIPNLQGYIVYNVHSKSIEAHVETQPITGPVSFSAADGSAMVVFVDINSGAVVGARA